MPVALVWCAAIAACCFVMGCAAPVAPPITVTVERLVEVEAAPDLPQIIESKRKLRLSGHVTLPRSVAGLANARDGAVLGAPVTVRDVLTGRRIATGVSFYDGSYTVDVPAEVGKRPVVVTVDLVDAKTRAALFPLAAPVQLAPELAEQTLEITPASTAWYALLYRMAARQNDQPAPDWTTLVPGVTTKTLAGLIVGSKASAVDTFSLLASGEDGLGSPATADGLKGAIQKLVDKLVSNVRPSGKGAMRV